MVTHEAACVQVLKKKVGRAGSVTAAIEMAKQSDDSGAGGWM